MIVLSRIYNFTFNFNFDVNKDTTHEHHIYITHDKEVSKTFLTIFTLYNFFIFLQQYIENWYT